MATVPPGVLGRCVPRHPAAKRWILLNNTRMLSSYARCVFAAVMHVRSTEATVASTCDTQMDCSAVLVPTLDSWSFVGALLLAKPVVS